MGAAPRTAPTPWPRDFAREALPRLTLPLAERVGYALAWYRDGVRASDISAVTKLPGFALTVAITAAGLPVRSGAGAFGRLSLVAPLTDLRAGTPMADVALRYQLGAESVAGLYALVEAGRARRAPDGRTGRVTDPPVWRCQRPACHQLNALPAARCAHCGWER